MRKLLKMEVYQLRHEHICLLMFAIAFLGGIFLGSGYLEQAKDYNALPGGYSVVMAMLNDSIVNIILFSVFASLLIGKSFSNRTILLKITSGNSRRNVFLSKAISTLIISIVTTIIFPIVGGITVTLKYGWNAPILDSAIILMKSIICTLLLDSAIYSVTILIAMIFRDTIKTVTASTIIIFFNAIYMSNARILNLPISMHPMRLLKSILQNNFSFQYLTISLYAAMLTSAILMLGYTIFRKCELK